MGGFLLDEKMVILVVDDQGKALSNILNFLRYNESYQIEIAASVEEAKYFLRKQPHPKYALVDLDLSESKHEYAGIELFKFIYQFNIPTKPIVVSAYRFDQTKPYFMDSLKEALEDNLDIALQDIRDNYIDKLSPFNYLRAIAAKIDELEKIEKLGNMKDEIQDNGQQIKVFISYAREDIKVAKKLYKDLKNEGITPWLDNKDIHPGQNWKMVIRQAIESSSYFFALLSNSISKRGYAQKELKIALELLDKIPQTDIFIIPIRLDKCTPVDERLISLNYVDLFVSYEEGFKSILKVFNEKIMA